MRFVHELTEVPDRATVVFSAHGVSPAVRAAAAARGCKVIDATCPLVTKVHLEAIRFARLGYEILLVGHAGHEEVEGTMGEAAGADPAGLLGGRRRGDRRGGPGARGAHHPDDPVDGGHAADRRDAQAALSEDPRSRQGRHLLRHPEPPGRRAGAREAGAGHPRRRLAQLVQLQPPGRGGGACRRPRLPGRRRLGDRPGWLEGVETIGITSGASAPEFLVQEIVRRLGGPGVVEIEEVLTVEEDVHFPLPPEVSGGAPAGAALIGARPATACRAALRESRLRDGRLARHRRGDRPPVRGGRRARRAGGARPEARSGATPRSSRPAGPRPSPSPATSPTRARSRRDRGGRRALGRLDVLVNNAGLGGATPLEDADDARWDAILATNLTAVFRVTRAAAPHLSERRAGHQPLFRPRALRRRRATRPTAPPSTA